jgi:hypothetical protein
MASGEGQHNNAMQQPTASSVDFMPRGLAVTQLYARRADGGR